MEWKTTNANRVSKAFDGAFAILREETESVAARLGFMRPGATLSEVLDIELRRSIGGWKQKHFGRLPPPLRARIRCAEILEFLVGAIEESGGRRGFGNGRFELMLACNQIDILHDHLAIALSGTIAPDVSSCRTSGGCMINMGTAESEEWLTELHADLAAADPAPVPVADYVKQIDKEVA